MKYMAILMLMITTGAHAADASACYTIASADARAYCLARARHDPGMCYAVQDSGLRSMCLAEVRE